MNVSVKRFFTNNFTLVSFLLTTYVVVSLVQWYSSVVDEEISIANRNEMHETCQQLEIMLENILAENKKDLNTLAKHIPTDNAYDASIIDFLNSQSQVEEFDSLFYVDLNGLAIAPQGEKGEKYDFSKNNTFRHALKEDFVVSKPHLTNSKGELSFELAVPVKNDNQVFGVLYSQASMENFEEAVSKITKGNGYVFLLDTALNIIFTNSQSHSSATNVTTEDLEVLGIENAQAALNDAKRGNSGAFNYSKDGTDKILIYTPIDMTDWILAVSVNHNIINSSLAEAAKNINSVAGIILVILLGLTAYTWFTRTSLLRSLEQAAYYDPLTKLPNLLKFKLDIGLILKNNKNKKFSILKFDIDNFKIINELFGFEVGNKVLQTTKTAYESIDEPTLLVARINTDEFLIFAGNHFLDNIDKKLPIYERYFRNLLADDLGSHKLSFKYGKYQIEKGETDVDEIVNKVNLAHKLAKQNRSTVVHYYDKVVKMQMLLEVELTNKMENSLREKEFQIYLQPKFDIANDKIIGAEALIRWIGKNGQIIYPDSFIPLFEKNGFIIRLDEFVLESVCKTLRTWLDAGREILPISVNFSRVNLIQANLVEKIISIVDKYKIPHNYIDIELTESSMLGKEEIIQELFADLHANGFKISIDDFGAGYSSLGLLKCLKAHTLKLDKSFFNENGDIVRTNRVIGGVIRLAHSLNMEVVAEGIETAEQVNALRVVRCNAVQGYYYAKPMPVDDFEKLYPYTMI